MKNKELIIQLFDEMKKEFDDYLRIDNILKKLEEIYNDYNKISIISDDDLVLLDNISKKIVGYLKYILIKKKFDEEEVKNSIIYIREQLVNNLKNDFNYYEELAKKIKYYANLKNVINNDIKSDYGLILEFIEFCYKDKKLSLEQAVTLNFAVASGIVNKTVNNKEIEEKDEIEENSEPIYDQLEEIFKKYNYDYNSLNKRIREKFNKYAKLDYTDYILSKLCLYNVSQKDIVANQKEILRIIIDRNNNTFDQICNFIDNNNCTMSKLLSFGAVFHKKKKKYVTKKKITQTDGEDGIDIVIEEDDDLSISGTFDDFMANIEFLKRTDGVTLIDDDYLKKKKVFINTPNFKIVTNLEILRKYGICNKDDVPKDLTCLIGNFTAYQLDRFIEVGLFDYIRRYPSYAKITKNPFKFYKIRRGQDLGDIIVGPRGMKPLYTDDNMDLHGISYTNIGDEKRILQEKLSREVLDSLPVDFKRDIRTKYYSFTEEEYYRKLNTDSYRFAEFTPTRLFPKYEANTLPIQLESYLKTDDYNVGDYDESVLEDKYIKLLDNAYCRTSENNYGTTYNIKKDENTYEFRPRDYPNVVITISRQKVLRLCKLLKDNNFWINDNYSFDNKCDMLLCVLIKDSVLSYWEVSYLRNILKNIIGNTLEKNANFRHRGGK